MKKYLKSSIQWLVLLLGNLFSVRKRTSPVPESKKIVIITRKAIGDIILAIPAFEALRARFPAATIDLWTMKWNREVVDGLRCFDSVIYIEDAVAMHQRPLSLIGFVRDLRSRRYDMAVFFDSFMFPLYGCLAGIPVRIGYEIQNEGFALTHRVRISETDYRLENFLKVVGLTGSTASNTQFTYPVHLSPDERAHVKGILSGVRHGRRMIGIVPGGGRNPGQNLSAKNWAVAGFARITEELLVKDAVTILFFGKGAEDVSIMHQLIDILKIRIPDRLDNIISLVDKTSIRQAAYIMKQCAVVISNDTSLLHLAAAVGTPTVSMFGPTDPANLAPRGPQHRFLRSSRDCSPCYEQHGYDNCEFDCMDNISWQSVYGEIEKVLEQLTVVKGVPAENDVRTGERSGV